MGENEQPKSPDDYPERPFKLPPPIPGAVPVPFEAPPSTLAPISARIVPVQVNNQESMFLVREDGSVATHPASGGEVKPVLATTTAAALARHAAQLQRERDEAREAHAVAYQEESRLRRIVSRAAMRAGMAGDKAMMQELGVTDSVINQMAWIPINESLPKPRQTVEVKAGEVVKRVEFRQWHWGKPHWVGAEALNVTHWRPVVEIQTAADVIRRAQAQDDDEASQDA